MNMTREEAIRYFDCIVRAEDFNSKQAEAARIALAALRGPTREMVERMRGEWRNTVDNDCEMYVCSKCGARDIKAPYEYDNPRLYCYHCGAPMTDEAVDTTLVSWEEVLKND